MGLEQIILKDRLIKEKNGVFYFSDAPADIRPSTDENPADKSKWSFWRKENFRFFNEELASISKEKTVLDIGAGQSDFKEIIFKFNKCSLDFYPYPGVDVVCDFTSGFPFKDNSFDVVILSNVLEHVAEPENLLKECYRALKPQGMVLGAVPFLIKIHQRPYDFYRYTDINLEHILKKANFSEIKITPAFMIYIIVFNAVTEFFIDLIKKSSFLPKLFFRAVWKIVRLGFKIFAPFLKKYPGDKDSPLGYLFKAAKF